MGIQEQITTITASCECTEVAFNTNPTLHGSINICAPRSTDSSTDTAPLALVAVIDISYSMMGDRIELAKETLKFIARQLKPRDMFAIVTFGSEAVTVFPSVLMTEENFDRAVRKIKSIEVNGCTALSAGLFEGIDCMHSVPDTHTSSVMLLTDGQANLGITNGASLVTEMEKKLSKIDKDVTVFTFGYGRDHNAAFLRGISDATNGMYYFIERTAQIQPAFAECLGGVASVALRNVSLKMISGSFVEIKNVLADLPQSREGNSRVLQLGNLSSGERRNIPIELQFKKLSKPVDSTKQIEFVLSYETTSGSQSSSCELVISRPNAKDCKNEKSDDFIEIDEQCNRVKVAETLKEVISLGERKQLDQARTRLKNLVIELQKSPSCNSPFTQSLIEDVRESVDTLADIGTFERVGIKYLYSLSRSHYQQRASGVSSSAASAYLTDGQRDMLKAIGTNVPSAPARTTVTMPSTSTKTPSAKAPSAKTTKPETKKTEVAEPEEPAVSKERLGRGVRRLITDLAEIKKHPLPCVTAEPLESDIFEWHCNMQGPEGSPYRHVVFHIIMQFPHTYPFQPPKLFFCSFIKHEHVFKTWICLDMLQEFEWSSKAETDTPYTGWTTAYSVHSVLLQLQSFLFDKADLSAEEVSKAKTAASKFSCRTCPHRGLHGKYWPAFPKSVAKGNPLEDVTVALANVKTFAHNPKPVPEILSNTTTSSNAKATLQPKSTPQSVGSETQTPKAKPTVDNVVSSAEALETPKAKPAVENDNDEWEVVKGRGKNKQVKPTKGQRKIRNGKSTGPLIQTSNRFVIDVSEVSIPSIQTSQAEEPSADSTAASEPDSPPKVNSTTGQVIKVPVTTTSQSKQEEEEIDPKKSKACQKKNAKRRRKLKRIKEEREKVKREAERQAEFARREAERLRQAAIDAENEEEAKRQKALALKAIQDQQQIRAKQSVSTPIVASSLQDALDQLKGSGRGLHRSLFIFLPDTLILEIFSYLSVPDLIKVSQCCRVFHQIGTKKSLWKSLCARYFPTSTVDSSCHPKVRFGREVLATKAQLFCFHTRKSFEEDVLGIPISFQRNPRTKQIQYISTTLDLLSREAYFDDSVRKSVWKRPFTHWLPLYITLDHADSSWKQITSSIAKLCDSKTFKPWMALDVLPKLMNTMVVSVMSGETHASIVAIEGYCAFHHLMLKMIEKYPQLSDRIDSTIGKFIKEERFRTKENTPSLGDFIPLLTVSENYRWSDVRSAYVQENFDRNALWVIKKYPALQKVDRGYAGKGIVNQNRLQKTFDANRTSMRLLMFHVYFLSKIARPDGRSLKEVTSNYDLFYGRPTAQMKEELQQHCKRVLAVENWPSFFRMIGMKVPTQQNVTFVLNQAVVNSKSKGYHR